jgi:Zn-dependent protease
MLPTHSGSFRLFRFAGIQVFLHWSWFIVALYGISTRGAKYTSVSWGVAEYVTLFVIVTLHEFGHALACRQTGGQAHDIVLWPLGGIAFVSPPPRAGATLWSIAAGPLVNVVLVPVILAVSVASHALGWTAEVPDLGRFIRAVTWMNLGLLIFNLLPIYPLDGGQILRSLLWFPLGRARSLQVAAILGIIGLVSLFGLLFYWSQLQLDTSSLWLALIAFFLSQRCWLGLREAKIINALTRMPRHPEFACPSCHESPPGGPLWGCRNCHGAFDPFSTHAVCPHCQTPHSTTRCVYCGADHPIAMWNKPSEPPTLHRPV